MPEEIRYDRNSGQYRDLKTGRFVGRSRVLKLLDQEVQRTEVRLAAQTRLLAQGRLTLSEWQTQMAETLKASHLRMAMFASGGREHLESRHYGAIGHQLKRQYEFLDRFAQDLATGRLTTAQAVRRSRLYGKSVRLTFFRVENLTRQLEGFTVGRRLLDPQARHCGDCIQHQRPEWVAIDEIVSPGTACACQNQCRCQVFYAKLTDLIR